MSCVEWSYAYVSSQERRQAVGDVRSTTVRHPSPVLETIGTVLAPP